MLRELRIRNFAVVETVVVPFVPGFNVLTGETGAGKSILVDALLLLRGARAQADVIRGDADTATVEAVYEVAAGSGAAAVLAAAGLEADDGVLVVRRELTRSGRHRAFVNDSAVTVALLERLGDELIDVHGQHEHQRLLDPVRQLELLDRFADVEADAGRLADLFGRHRSAAAEVARLRTAERDRAQREDLLRFQVGELDAARLRPGEEEELRAERRRAQHAERFAGGVAEVMGLLHDDPEAAAGRLTRAARVLRDLGRLDPAFAVPADGLETTRAHLEEMLAALRVLRDGLEIEPGRLEAIDDRLDAIVRLRRKYGESEEAMLRYRDQAATELEQLGRHQEVLAVQEAALAALREELEAAAGALSARRATVAARLAAQVERQLRRLGMEKAVFRIALDRAGPADMTARGLDRVEFELSTNPGEAARPVARVASGGELSRTMLALEAVLAQADPVPTLVFDEIDAGIGGGVAAIVGQTLAAAARGRQVICVTHLAPIAVLATNHVQIEKVVRGGRTRVTAALVEGDDRVAEIARMLGGDATAAAIAHARTLLAGGPRTRGV